MPPPPGPPDPAVLAVARQAAVLVTDGARVGLGTGRAARIRRRARHARSPGPPHPAAATSDATARQAERLGIPLLALEESVILDLTVDGADEVAPNLDLVKGWGGALVRERIVAAASRRQVILVGPEKLVQRLGQRGRIPVEVIPLAHGLVSRELRRLGLTPSVRAGDDGTPAHTDNGNVTLDCAPAAPSPAPPRRASRRRSWRSQGSWITGLFLGTAGARP
jgi:ribose 5-phosphate isomerase A